MAFKPWFFKYNPPKTVPQAPPAPASADAGMATSTATTNAARLLSGLDDLIATSEYLQQVVLARSRGRAVVIDLAVDVDVARALETLYAVSEAPSSITMDMYNHLLDAEMTALQVEMALPSSSPYEVNAFQVAAASQVTALVEQQLVDTGTSKDQLPLLLRGLKGDAVIFRATQAELKKYPAAQSPITSARQTLTSTIWNTQAVIYAATLDVSDPLYQQMNEYLAAFSRSYASVYKLAADVNAIERDAEEMLNVYFMQPVEDIIRMVSLFQAMRGLLHVPRLKGLLNSLTGLVFVRLQAEATGMRFFFDRFMRIAVTPLKSMTNTVGRALGSLQQMAKQASRLSNALTGVVQSFRHTSGALKGMSYAYDCGLPHNAPIPKPMKGIAGLDKAGQAVTATWSALDKVQQAPGKLFAAKTSQAMTALASHLQWGLDACHSKQDASSEAFTKIANRRLDDRAAQLDLLCSTQVLDSLSTLGKAVIQAQQGGTSATAATAATPAEAAKRILVKLDSGTGARFALQDGSVIVTPPDVPAVPAPVEDVLRRGGLDRLVPDDLRDIKGVIA